MRLAARASTSKHGTAEGAARSPQPPFSDPLLTGAGISGGRTSQQDAIDHVHDPIAGGDRGLLAGIITIALRSIGFIGKLLYEAIEEIDLTQVEAITATGASRGQVIA